MPVPPPSHVHRRAVAPALGWGAGRGSGSAAAFSFVEVLVAIAIAIVLLSVLMPVLAAGRLRARTAACADHQRRIGQGWLDYLDEHEAFPLIPLQPGWHWGGVRFNSATGRPHLDFSRPINRPLAGDWRAPDGDVLFRCPLDEGITDPTGALGTGERTAYRAYGTSYRANHLLLNPPSEDADGEARVRTPLPLAAVAADHDRLLLMGAPVWFEVLSDTGRSADWYGRPGWGNVLFLDGSVRLVDIPAALRSGELAVDPVPDSLGPPPPRDEVTADEVDAGPLGARSDAGSDAG